MAKSVSAAEALKRLKDGNKKFQKDCLDGKLQDSERRAELVGGQAPFAAILSCADSRVPPELVFDAGLGELFVVRVAGNIANTSSIGSLEYAIANLGYEADCCPRPRSLRSRWRCNWQHQLGLQPQPSASAHQTLLRVF